MKIRFRVGLDWECPHIGINWHRCGKYWNFGLYPFWFNIEYYEEE